MKQAVVGEELRALESLSASFSSGSAQFAVDSVPDVLLSLLPLCPSSASAIWVWSLDIENVCCHSESRGSIYLTDEVLIAGAWKQMDVHWCLLSLFLSVRWELMRFLSDVNKLLSLPSVVMNFKNYCMWKLFRSKTPVLTLASVLNISRMSSAYEAATSRLSVFVHMKLTRWHVDHLSCWICNLHTRTGLLVHSLYAKLS